MMGEQSLENPFKRALLGGTPQIGLWSSLASNIVAELLSYAGYDWLLFDTEHSPNEIPELITQLQALKGSPTAAVVRPAVNDTVILKRLLDIGFYNFLIPFVQTADEARAAVAATRYPPEGVRGVSVMQRSNHYGYLPDYFAKINQAICVLVQIETLAGVEALPEICAVEGVDGVFVGPSDLSASLGLLGQSNHPTVQDTIRRINDQCRRLGKVSGILAPVPADAERYLDWGFGFVAVGSDLGLLRNASRDLAARFKKP